MSTHARMSCLVLLTTDQLASLTVNSTHLSSIAQFHGKLDAPSLHVLKRERETQGVIVVLFFVVVIVSSVDERS